jgi:hypothetical protein
VGPGSRVQFLAVKRLAIISQYDIFNWINERCRILVEAALDKPV